MFMHGAMQREGSPGSHFDRALVEQRKRTWKAEAHRAGVGIGRVAETCRAATENLRLGQQLDMDFQPDDRLVFREQFRRDGGRIWSGFSHGLGDYSIQRFGADACKVRLWFARTGVLTGA